MPSRLRSHHSKVIAAFGDMAALSPANWAFIGVPDPASNKIFIDDAFRSEFEDFDWALLTGSEVHLNNASGPSKTRTCTFLSEDRSILFTEEGFWYYNKRSPRRHPALAKDWPEQEPSFEPDIEPYPIQYFFGIDLNVELNKVMEFGREITCSRKLNRYHVLDHNGYITRLEELPEDIGHQNDSRNEIPRKFVQSFRTKYGKERIVETGLGKDARTFVLVNEEIEREMDQLEDWHENKAMLRLTRRDGKIVPDCGNVESRDGFLGGIITSNPVREKPLNIFGPVVTSKTESRKPSIISIQVMEEA
ncbi:unnamed protein product [Diplocarpon coronariae]